MEVGLYFNQCPLELHYSYKEEDVHALRVLTYSSDQSEALKVLFFSTTLDGE